MCSAKWLNFSNLQYRTIFPFLIFERNANEIGKKEREAVPTTTPRYPSFTHPQADMQRYSYFSYLQDSTKASMIAPTGTPCSCACPVIHSLACALTLQHTGTDFSQNPLRPAPSRLPPQVFLSCSISITVNMGRLPAPVVNYKSLQRDFRKKELH